MSQISKYIMEVVPFFQCRNSFKFVNCTVLKNPLKPLRYLKFHTSDILDFFVLKKKTVSAGDMRGRCSFRGMNDNFREPTPNEQRPRKCPAETVLLFYQKKIGTLCAKFDVSDILDFFCHQEKKSFTRGICVAVVHLGV